jgi:Flp pilus assembly CpaF family ATPase
MRSSPDRIILGEMKDEVAAAFLEALNTGHHGGMATVHANSAVEALKRFELLVMRAGMQMPLNEIRSRVATTIHAVVHLRKFAGQRELTEVALLSGYSEQDQQYQTTAVYKLPASHQQVSAWQRAA